MALPTHTIWRMPRRYECSPEDDAQGALSWQAKLLLWLTLGMPAIFMFGFAVWLYGAHWLFWLWLGVFIVPIVVQGWRDLP